MIIKDHTDPRDVWFSQITEIVKIELFLNLLFVVVEIQEGKPNLNFKLF